MSTNQTQTAWSILAEGAILAAFEILRSKGIDTKTVNAQALSDCLKAELTARIVEINGEWKDAVEAHMGEEMLRYIMNVQANYIALKALQNGGLIS